MCADIVSASALSPSDARRLKINNIVFYSVVLHTYFDIGTVGLLRQVVKILRPWSLSMRDPDRR